MNCPQCGKETAGRYCPMCGHEVPATSGRSKSPKHRSRLIAIVAVLILVVSGGTAWFAQTYGTVYGWHLDSLSTVGIGAKYSSSFTSGHYIAGVDLPAGKYTITAVDGQGSIATTSSFSEWMSSTEQEPYRQTLSGVQLSEGNTLTVLGLTVKVQTAHAQSNITPRVHTDTEPTELSGSNNQSYTAGVDFPAGDYRISAIAGKGNVSSDNLFAGGIHNDMSTELSDEYIQEFRNVHLPQGTVLTLNGVDVRLTPS